MIKQIINLRNEMLIAVGIVTALIGLFITFAPYLSDITDTFQSVKENQLLEEMNLTFDVIGIENEIIENLEKYYSLDNFDRFRTKRIITNQSYRNLASWSKFNRKTTITMNINTSKEKYPRVFAHELTHHTLNLMGVVSANEDTKGYRTIHESISTAYMYFINKDKLFNYWRIKNTEYNQILNQIEGKEECLNKVWVTDEKIEEFEELKNRFINSCGINWTQLEEYEIKE